MDRFGESLRRRARELGLSDAELARRAGIEASKLGKWVRGTHEPDFATLLHLCKILDTTPNDLLIPSNGAAPSERERLISAVKGACEALPDYDLHLVARMVAAASPSSADG